MTLARYARKSGRRQKNDRGRQGLNMQVASGVLLFPVPLWRGGGYETASLSIPSFHLGLRGVSPKTHETDCFSKKGGVDLSEGEALSRNRSFAVTLLPIFFRVGIGA